MTVDEWNKIYIAKAGTFLTDKLIEEAYEIINRQKAEIERLKAEIDTHLETIVNHDSFTLVYTRRIINEFMKQLKEMDEEENRIFDNCASTLVSEEYKRGRYEKISEIQEAINKLTKEWQVTENENN